MKVLFISHGPNLDGGAERVLMWIIKSLPREHYEPVVVVPGQGEFSERLETLGIPYHVVSQAWMVFAGAVPAILAVNSVLNLSAVHRLREIIATERIDLVYSNSVTIFAGGVAAKLEGVPHVWHLHETVFDNPSFNFGFGPAAYRAVVDTLSDRVIGVSRAVTKYLWDLGEKVVVVYNGIDSSAWDIPDPAEVQAVRNELGIPPEKKVLIFVGTLSANKAPEKAVEVIAKMQNDDVYLLLVGDRGERAVARRMEELILANGLSGRVIFTGFRKDVPRLLALADVALVPSINEAFGLATVEAMAAGLPVVAGRGGGNMEIITDGETGYLVDDADPALMAQRIESLISDPIFRRKMGEAAHQSSRRFSLDHHLEGILAVLDAAAKIQNGPIGFGDLAKRILTQMRKEKTQI